MGLVCIHFPFNDVSEMVLNTSRAQSWQQIAKMRFLGAGLKNRTSWIYGAFALGWTNVLR